MKTIITLITFLLALPFFVLSQEPNTVEFNYDKAGNRILRYAIYIPGIIQSHNQQPDSLYTNNLTKAIIADSVVVDDISISIYPNPTLGKFKVIVENYCEADNVQYSLYTLAGQIIIKGKVNNKETQIDLQNHESGPYIFRLIINGKSTSWRIIKR